MTLICEFLNACRPLTSAVITADNYHDHGPEVLTATVLKEFILKTPAHANALLTGGADREPTPGMALGTIVHDFMAGLESKYSPAEADLRTKAGKALWADLIDRGVTPVKNDVFYASNAMAASLKELAKHSTPEVLEREKVYQCEYQGITLRAKPDVFSIIGGDLISIIDYKTTRDASTRDFTREIFSRGYQYQMIFYGLVVMCCRGLSEMPVLELHAVESVAPYLSNTFILSNDLVDHAVIQVIDAIKRYVFCVESGHWPGYDSGNVVEMPDWMKAA